MADPEPITTYPPEWAGHINSMAGALRLDVTGHSLTVEVSAGQIERVYLPLLALLRQARESSSSRVIAGLAGIPGSGKSTFAAILSRVAEQVLGLGEVMTVGMDGWHLPNIVLDNRTTTDADGRTVALSQRKGGPDSFDVPGLATAIRQLKTAKETVLLPVYDRQLHDPVTDALTVPAATRIVVVEGNFLLYDQPRWDEVSSLLAPKLFLECDEEMARQRTVQRHSRGGLSEADAVAKYDRNDRLNAEIVLSTADSADVVITL